MLHLYGTGGVGKSTFLRLCRQKAFELDVCFMQLDSRDFNHSERGIANALLRQIQCPPDSELDLLQDFCTELESLAGDRIVVLAIDTFEEMRNMENWVRERLIPLLPQRSLLLFAGRHPLRGGWLLSPVWRERLRQLPIPQLERSDCVRYLEMCGITSEGNVELIWRQTTGHPLAMSLAAAAHTMNADAKTIVGDDLFDELAALWMQEVPDRELRRHVESASVLRVFDQERLSFVMEEAVPSDVFDRLSSLSFVRKSERGWQLHDLMRESTLARLKERAPNQYRRLMERSAAYYANAILASSDRSMMEWEVGELFRYTGVDVLRALLDEPENSSYYWETVTDVTLQDALAYAEWRENNTQPVSGVEIDPVTGELFRIEYTAEQVRYNAAPLDLKSLYVLEPSSIKLLRDEEERVCALAICIPFHAVTLPWLEQDPLCSPYLNSLKLEERTRLASPQEQPAGWFLRSFDYADILNPRLRTTAIYLIYSFLCRGGLLVCTPFDNEIGRKAYTGFGFNIVEGATHCNHDGRTPTPTYELDTRGEKLLEFLNHLFRRAGMEWKSTIVNTDEGTALLLHSPLLDLLSDREREVALQVLSGFSNMEIAKNLIITESTVKKHLKSIYVKLDIHKRTQLAVKLMIKP
nr:helix-turn-helix transcriptional regulator [Paenibacillus sedimenti]